MEALRTQNDNLQWEVNRLGAENQKLRSENPERSARVDFEAELDEARRDVATLTNQVQTYQAQLAALPERSSEERTDPELQAATAEAAQLREANAGLAADLDECHARETTVLLQPRGLPLGYEAYEISKSSK